jgi:hypothetical protein
MVLHKPFFYGEIVQFQGKGIFCLRVFRWPDSRVHYLEVAVTFPAEINSNAIESFSLKVALCIIIGIAA